MTIKLKIVSCLLGMLLLNNSYASSGTDFGLWLLSFQRMKEVAPVTNKAFLTECGECHFAYQPGLLPTRSWERMMTTEALRKHFGVNAEIDSGILQEIREYAIANAADKSYYKRSRKIAHSIAENEAPLLISGLRYFKRTHQNIPEKMVSKNASVKSISFCDKCHTQAAQGVFDNDTVSIPNFPER